MQRNANRNLGHAEPLCGFADGNAVDRDRRDDRPLAGGKRIKSPSDLAVACCLLRLGRRRIKGLFQHDFHAAPYLAEGIDQLETRDRKEPRFHRQVALPSVALQVNGKKCFLHDILWVDAALPDTPPCKTPHKGCRLSEKLRISPFISPESGLQQERKLGLVPAFQGTLLLLRCIEPFRYASPDAAGLSSTQAEKSITKR